MRVVIDKETGEILTELKKNDKILRNASIESFKELELTPKNETYTKLYHNSFPMLTKTKLTSADLLVFMCLSINLLFASNVAKYPNGRMITRETLAKGLDLSLVTIKRSITSLVNEGLVVEARTMEGKVFILNPYVVSKGEKVSRTVYDLFRKSKWARW